MFIATSLRNSGKCLLLWLFGVVKVGDSCGSVYWFVFTKIDFMLTKYTCWLNSTNYGCGGENATE